jgi:hypothetical protein
MLKKFLSIPSLLNVFKSRKNAEFWSDAFSPSVEGGQLEV